MKESRVFTTDQVVQLLSLDPKRDTWRVVKFAESREYGIIPSVSTAKGSGSRRLYNLENVLEMALALRFLEIGLRPAAIGDVVQLVRRRTKRLSAKLLSGEISSSTWLGVTLRPRIGAPLKESRVQFTAFYDKPFELEEFREDVKDVTGQEADSDMLLIFVGPMFQGILNRLRQSERKQ